MYPSKLTQIQKVLKRRLESKKRLDRGPKERLKQMKGIHHCSMLHVLFSLCTLVIV
jgi:hypothetical protein